mgnify:CR=1 FL=1
MSLPTAPTPADVPGLTPGEEAWTWNPDDPYLAGWLLGLLAAHSVDVFVEDVRSLRVTGRDRQATTVFAPGDPVIVSLDGSVHAATPGPTLPDGSGA